MAGFLKTLPSSYGPDLTFWTILGYYLDVGEWSLRVDLAGWFDQAQAGQYQSPVTVPLKFSGAANPITRGVGGGSLSFSQIVTTITAVWPDAVYVP